MATLHRLVSKMKRQTIADPGDSPRPALRKSARINALKEPSNRSVHDSGTESDDEELQHLDSSVTKVSSPLDDCVLAGRSPPTLTSEPPQLSDFDTDSWDSAGCESGFAAETEEDEDDDARKTPLGTAASHGAFRRTTRCDCDFSRLVAGEKRRHSALSQSADTDADLPISSRLRSNERDIIVAARRTPVKLLIMNSRPVRETRREDVAGSPPGHPQAKRGRHNSYSRPSLDFDKMREHRFVPGAYEAAEDKSETERLKLEWALPPAHAHSAGGCSQPDCLFRPLSSDEGGPSCKSP